MGRVCNAVGVAARQLSRCLTSCGNVSRRLIVIEGNIGAGKTTLSCALAKLPHVKVYHEPAPNTPYLAKFYENPKKYALKLQLLLFKQRLFLYMDAMKHLFDNGGWVVLDRSVYGDGVFANVVYNEGHISEHGYRYYLALKSSCLSLVLPPHAVVYLDSPPSICMNRIRQRSREYEEGLPVDYLEKLATEYDALLESMRSTHDTVVLRYDWSQPWTKAADLQPDHMASYSPFAKVLQDIHALRDPPWGEQQLLDCVARCRDADALYASTVDHVAMLRPPADRLTR